MLSISVLVASGSSSCPDEVYPLCIPAGVEPPRDTANIIIEIWELLRWPASPRPPRLHHNGPRQLSYKNENNACLYLQFHTGAAAATAISITRVLQFYHYHVH